MTQLIEDRPGVSASRRRIAAWLCTLGAVAAATGGLVMLLLATHPGPGVSPDSLDYLRGARSLMDHHGFGIEGAAGGWKAETHLAPFFPWCLSLIAHDKAALPQVARLLNASLFILNTLLATLLVAWGAGKERRWIGALAGATAFGLSPVLIEVHSNVWSEPTYFAFWFACVLAIGTFESNNRTKWLLFAGCAAGLACLDRYSSLSLVGAAMLSLLLARQNARPLSRRVMDAILFGVVAMVPIALLVLRNLRLTGNPADRSMSFHPPSAQDWRTGMIAVAGWILPHSNRSWVVAGAIVVGLMVIVVLIPSWRRVVRSDESPADESSRGVLRLVFLFVPVYAAFLFCSLLFFDAHTVLDIRILSPLYLPIVLLMAVAIARAWPDRWALNVAVISRLLICVLAVVLCGAETYRGARWTIWARANGLGYSNTRWQQSDLMKYARSLTPGTIVYSNAPDAMMLLSDVAARPLPKVESPGTRGIPPSYRNDLNTMRLALKHANTFIFYFRRVGRSYLVSEQKLQDDLRLRRSLKTADGSVYVLRFAPKAKPTTSP